MSLYSCPGGRNSSQPCPEGFYNDNPGQSDIGACQVIYPTYRLVDIFKSISIFTNQG